MMWVAGKILCGMKRENDVLSRGYFADIGKCGRKHYFHLRLLQNNIIFEEEIIPKSNTLI
jgi:hypothetical protein